MFRRGYHQFLLALAFLTRLPVDWIMPVRAMPLALSTWAFPLAGAFTGAVASLPMLLPGPSLLNAALSVGLAAWITGLMYEGALAGFAGIVVLILTCLVRIFALSLLEPSDLIAAAAGGRAAIVVIMAALLSAADRPDGRNQMGSFAIFVVILIVLTDDWVLPLIGGIVVTSFVFRRIERRKGVYSGDVPGATALLAETGMLAAMAFTA